MKNALEAIAGCRRRRYQVVGLPAATSGATEAVVAAFGAAARPPLLEMTGGRGNGGRLGIRGDRITRPQPGPHLLRYQLLSHGSNAAHVQRGRKFLSSGGGNDGDRHPCTFAQRPH